MVIYGILLLERGWEKREVSDMVKLVLSRWHLYIAVPKTGVVELPRPFPHVQVETTTSFAGEAQGSLCKLGSSKKNSESRILYLQHNGGMSHHSRS